MSVFWFVLTDAKVWDAIHMEIIFWMNFRKNRMNGSFFRMNGKKEFCFARICG